MLPAFLVAVWLALISLFVNGQIITATDPNSGQTIVEDITIDPVQGLPTTITISTLAAPVTTTTATTTTPTTTTTTPNNPQGPVGQPAPTTATPGAPTPFTFTTIINGQTVVSIATFTPTNPVTTPVAPTVSGTRWDLSSYLQQYGPTKSVGSASPTVGVDVAVYISIGIFMIFGQLLLS
ncbi:hypothetical protein APHAL10511_004576 [Amanita phalloides]|nr:hypothetical protein APHAL10511_004576 [Amanita phalloides]